jgi:hypothetical protein
MRRRREHIECESREGGRGCIILGTSICTVKKKENEQLAVIRRWVSKVTIFSNALCCFVLVLALAIATRMIGIATRLESYWSL